MKDLYRIEGHDVFIDIRLSDYQDFFNDWDYSPVRMRDLDDDLYAYLIDCGKEIPSRYALNVVLHLPGNLKDTRKEQSNRTSYTNYLQYRLRHNLREKHSMFIRMGWYFLMGIIFISLAYILEELFGDWTLLNILREGFFIGGWVLFWELFSNIFFHLKDANKTIGLIDRLLKSPLHFSYT